MFCQNGFIYTVLCNISSYASRIPKPFYRLNWSIPTISLWPKKASNWLFTSSSTPSCTPKRNSGSYINAQVGCYRVFFPEEQIRRIYYLHRFCRVDTEEWMAAVEVLLSKSSEACQWMVQYLVGPEGREIIRSEFIILLVWNTWSQNWEFFLWYMLLILTWSSLTLSLNLCSITWFNDFNTSPLKYWYISIKNMLIGWNSAQSVECKHSEPEGSFLKHVHF